MIDQMERRSLHAAVYVHTVKQIRLFGPKQKTFETQIVNG